MDFENEIILLLSSDNFIIYVQTEEEERLEYIVKKIGIEKFHQQIYIWNFIEGYTNNPNYTESSKKNPLKALEIILDNYYNNTKVFFLKDFYQFMNDISIIRQLKNIYRQLRAQNQYIIISGIDKIVPNALKEYITYIQLPLPNNKEIQREVIRLVRTSGSNTHKGKLIENIYNIYNGYTINQVRRSISELISQELSTKRIIKHIIEEKKKLIERIDILEFSYNDNKVIDIGGLTNLKNWLRVRKYALNGVSSTYGLKQPKGIILVGVQGTGKSLSSEVIAVEWKLPLLKLNINQGFVGILGESESKIKNVIDTCETISPCILWIDEIDKIFTRSDYIKDSGTTNRITSIFLTWLSEKKNNIFIVATANSIQNLPVELLRKGRFDEIFFVDLPTLKERINIFKIHLKKIRPLTWHKYNLFYLSKISKRFSGAEIEQAIQEGMYRSFYEKREFKTLDIIRSIYSTIPLAKTEEEEILKLRKWGYSGKVKVA